MPEPLKDPTPLKPNYLPENLYDRQEEQKLLGKLASNNSAPQNLFLHGPRGTGKTHVTHLALEEIEDECPELEHNDHSDLENFCLYRDDSGFCSALETQCVLQADD